MCADSADGREVLAPRLAEHDDQDGVPEKHRDAATPNEARARYLREVSHRGRSEEGVLQSQLSGDVSKPNRLRSSLGR